MQAERTAPATQLQFPLDGVVFGDPRVPERLWAKVQPDPLAGCWEWTGARIGSKREYGGASFENRMWTAHRVFYHLLVRPVSKTEHVHHDCRNTLCVNPAHIAAIAQEDHWGHGHADKTHCPRGHEYTPANTVVRWRKTAKGTDSPNRMCRTCRTQLAQASYRKTKEIEAQ